MTTYEVFENTRGEELVRCIGEDGSTWEFKKNEANADYQRYLRWLENPNEVEHLTEIPTP
jgi:hypothetical protein